METKNNEISRRTVLIGAALGATTLAGAGVLAACSTPDSDKKDNEGDASGYTAKVVDPKASIDYKTATNFNTVPESTTAVGTTTENLVAALTGETGAVAKYEAFSAVAAQAGYSQIARLFQATADAEKIHIDREFAELQKIDPNAVRPVAPEVQTNTTDINLIFGANGEIYETSDMYPQFIKVATDSGDDSVARVFARAKLAESVHAERYMEAYNNIDNPDNDSFYVCPVCGYVHKGENFTACPICMTPKDSFKVY